MRRAVILCGAVSFIMAFLGGALAISFMTPASASAQAGQAQEVRASAFVLVGDDGQVYGRLGRSPGGVPNLQITSTTGHTAIVIGPGGFTQYDPPTGEVIFRAGRCVGNVVGCPGGLPGFNGVQISTDGSFGSLPQPSADRASEPSND